MLIFFEHFIQRIPKPWWVRLAIAIGPCILVGKDLLHGRVLYWGTPALQFVPWWMEGLRQIREGSLPLWNALNGMGAPLLANYQTAFFYPPNWVLCLFGLASGAPGVAWGYTLLALLHLIWGGWGMASLLRRLGAGTLAQVIGGLAFALSGYLVGRLEFISMIWVGAWIPWVLRYADEIASPVNLHAASARRPWLHFGLIACLAAQLLAGHAQLTWYTMEFAGVWIAVGAFRGAGWRGLARALARFAAAGLLAGLLASVQLLPTFEYLRQSQRASEVAYQEALTYSFWPWRFLSIFAPDFFGNPGKGNYWGFASFWEDHLYIGMLPVLMVVGSFFGLLKKPNINKPSWLNKPAAWLLWIFIFVGILFSLGINTPIFPFLYRYIPTFDMFQAPARYMIWVVIAGIILAAGQIDQWDYPGGKGLYWLRLGTAGAFAVALGAGIGWLAINIVKLTFIQATAMAGFWALGTGILALLTKYKERPGWRRVWPILVYGWLLADLVSAAWILNPMIDHKFYAPESSSVQVLKDSLEGGRIYLSRSDEYLLKFSRFFRFEDYRALEDLRRIRFALLPNLNLLEGFPHAGNFDPIVPARFAAWMKMVDRAENDREANMLSRMNVSLVERLDPVNLAGVKYEPTSGAQAATWFQCAEFQSSGADFLLAMARREFSPGILQVETLTHKNEPCESYTSQVVPVSSTRSGSLSFSTGQAQPGWLFLSQIWYPGWQARIDGQPAPIYRADYAFMALEIPGGEHQISLEYQPNSFRIGALLSILVLIGTVCAWLYELRTYRLRKNRSTEIDQRRE